MDKTILIVDDDQVDRMLLERWCSKMHLNYISVKDGTEAIKILQKEAINIVFSDIDMPIMSGVDLVNCIRNDSVNGICQLPVVAISGNESLGLGNTYRNFGFDYYLSKPPQLDQLNKLYFSISESNI